MIKIFYWSPFFSNVATIKAVINSAESLLYFNKKKNYDISLIDAIGEWGEYKEKIHKDLKVIKLNKNDYVTKVPKNSFIKSRISYFFIFFLNFFKLKRLINIEKPDFLIIHLITSLPIILSPFFNKKTKLILRISGLPKLNLFRYFLWKIYSKKIYKVTCPTKATYEYLIKQKIFDIQKIHILSDPIINIKKFVNQKDALLDVKFKDKNLILGIGRLTKQKNFFLLISAFMEIIKKHPNFLLLILGEGEDRKKLENFITQNNLKEKVFLLGYQDNVYKFLKKAKYFILSSLWEDPGFVITEAALSNTSIISSDCPNGPNEIIKNDHFLFQSGNKNDLLDKFDKVYSMNSKEIFKQKIKVKKEIKKFSKFNNFQKLIEILT